jgi:hypothetical protein
MIGSIIGARRASKAFVECRRRQTALTIIEEIHLHLRRTDQHMSKHLIARTRLLSNSEGKNEATGKDATRAAGRDPRDEHRGGNKRRKGEEREAAEECTQRLAEGEINTHQLSSRSHDIPI